MDKPKILICDDEEGVRESLSIILEKAYRPVLVSGGDEALKVLKENPDIKLVLLDVKMPKQDGLQVLKQIKNISSDISVIIITGYQTSETAAEAIKLGALDYIVKPIDSKHVLASVNKAL